VRQRKGKTEIWNLFKNRRGWRIVTYVEAEQVLGRAIIRYWVDEGWMIYDKSEGHTIYLTDAGVLNLYKGLRNIIAKDPERENELVNVGTSDAEKLH
jgi:hypothetical protein